MLSAYVVHCHACRTPVHEGTVEWEEAELTGVCPACDKFLEARRENELTHRLGDPAFIKSSRQARTFWLAAAIGLLPTGLVLLIVPLMQARVAGALALVFSLRGFGFAATWNPAREARHSLRGRCDLLKIGTNARGR